MTDFFNEIINGDYRTILGDLYVPAFACVAVSCCIIGFASVYSIFQSFVTIIFTNRKK